ncbi:terpenoid synthase [Aspergillus steynii IBT 23096]|uniref:Terpenoid synthase n=1 Tax=Aspergillus steynii IBT 23096 TaxID=1392250 RepID=A0A2I2GFQ7_9EURO|nr:terpenoid synthase [Aspergillus steynii IBT 23096]PLB51691.1 terpenoid synthase [Aspergillus steynii IBT 23096]
MVPLPSLSPEEYAEHLSAFLDEIQFSMPQPNPDLSIDKMVISHFEAQPWDPVLINKATRKAARSAEMMRMVYPYVDSEINIAYGIFCTYMFVIDDSDEALDAELASFEGTLFEEKSQQSPFLQSLFAFLNDLGSHFGPFSRTMIFKSMIEFITGRLIETRYKEMQPPSAAVKFPYYLRQKTGVAEPFAHFMFPEKMYPENECLALYILILPDLCDIISFVNDIFSFYKESILSSEVNYLSNVAMVQGIHVSESLKRTSKEAAESLKNIRAVLADHPVMLDTTIQAVWGWIASHISQARYRLFELDLHVPSVDGRILDTQKNRAAVAH